MKKQKLKYNKDFPQLISKIENMIIIGSLLPKERLIENDLAEKFGVSRAWVRDAFKILETKGLITMVPYRGAMVTSLSDIEVEEIFQVRMALEKLCNQLAAPNFTNENEKVLLELCEKMEEAYKDHLYEDAISYNSAFHEYITDIAENSYLTTMLSLARSKYYIFNTFAWSNSEIVKMIFQEHRSYITALKNQDFETLNQLATSHITHSKDVYLTQLKTRMF